MTFKRFISIIAINLLACWPLIMAQDKSLPAATNDLIEEWTTRLAQSTTPKDSMEALYNLFDLTERDDRGRYSTPLYQLAQREKDYDTQLDILRVVTSKYLRNDSITGLCLDLALQLPDSYDQQETVLFIQLERYISQLRRLPMKDRQDQLPALIESYVDDTDATIYQRILSLYKIATVLGYTIGGDLYTDYMDRLNVLIDHMPRGNGSLKTIFYQRVAMANSMSDNYKQAARADWQLLGIIDALQDRYAAQGRPFPNYDRNKYLSYRRLLGNFPILSREQIEEYNDSIRVIAARNKEVRDDLNNNRRATAYYLYATGQYDKALPVLKEISNLPDNSDFRRKLLKMLIDCANKTGDKSSLMQATTQYNAILEEYVRMQIDDKLRDMQVFFDINDLKDERIAALTEKADNDRKKMHSQLMAVSIALGVMTLVALVLAWRLFRNRRCRKNGRQV